MQVEHRSTLGSFPSIFVLQDGSNKQEVMLVLNIWQLYYFINLLPWSVRLFLYCCKCIC